MYTQVNIIMIILKSALKKKMLYMQATFRKKKVYKKAVKNRKQDQVPNART